MGEVEPDGQYVPAAQTEIEVVFLQNEPPGQGLLDDELTGQYWPSTHRLSEEDPMGQYVPARQTEMELVLLQNDPPGQGVFDTDPAGQKLPILHAI